jgi:hypothetical protein
LAELRLRAAQCGVGGALRLSSRQAHEKTPLIFVFSNPCRLARTSHHFASELKALARSANTTRRASASSAYDAGTLLWRTTPRQSLRTQCPKRTLYNRQGVFQKFARTIFLRRTTSIVSAIWSTHHELNQ